MIEHLTNVEGTNLAAGTERERERERERARERESERERGRERVIKTLI